MAKARWADPEFRANFGKSVERKFHCATCGETDKANFYLGKQGHKTNKACKKCHSNNAKARWHSKSILEKRLAFVKNYGLTAEQYLAMLDKQEGKCAICGEIPKTVRGLHIDHSHKTGVVRGLLCHGCNVGIGSLKEDAGILSKAIEYLRS